MNPAESIPWAIRPPNIPCPASTSFTCAGLKSPVIPANSTTSVSVTVLVNSAVCPTAISSSRIRFFPFEVPTVALRRL
jgi:hypothetical protein